MTITEKDQMQVTKVFAEKAFNWIVGAAIAFMGFSLYTAYGDIDQLKVDRTKNEIITSQMVETLKEIKVFMREPRYTRDQHLRDAEPIMAQVTENRLLLKDRTAVFKEHESRITQLEFQYKDIASKQSKMLLGQEELLSLLKRDLDNKSPK